MPTRPERVTLTNSSVDVLNAIRNSASQNYRDHIPIATPDSEVIRQIGAIIMDMPQLQNEFLSALINRIGRVIISSRMWENPLSMFKLGRLDFGEVIEDVFVELAKPHQYDPEEAESTVERREIPDVYSAFYILNYEKFYKGTVQEYDLKKAFLSINGVTDLINKIVESMYAGASYDEFLTMKYMLARRILNGQIPIVTFTAGATDEATMKTLAKKAKAVSNQMTFLNTKWNITGVHNFAPKTEQYLFMTADNDAAMDVDVLASAFNMDKAEFMGHRVLLDTFNIEDTDRLDELFGNQQNYVPLTQADIAYLNNVYAVLVDESFFKVIDFYDTTNSRYNEEGLYRNYWYHVGKAFCTSPFANCALFTTTAQTVTTVSISPASATIAVGGTVHLVAEVVAPPGAPQTVTYSSSDETVATVDNFGTVTGVGAGNATITARSTVNRIATDTTAITITAKTHVPY
jgi:hypothetical protein